MIKPFEGPPGDRMQKYEQQCPCGEFIELLTQKDNHPEYYTYVYVRCHVCGEYEAEFKLPVN